uniref:Putative ovule protein n=2 Tax=Solanum chacoense TaxID=4108 RepID=A0A0V0IZJ0_SOLCH
MIFRVVQITQHNVSIPSFVQAFVEACLSSVPNEDLLNQNFVFLIIDAPDQGLRCSSLSCLCKHEQFLLSTLSPSSTYKCSKASIFYVVTINIAPIFDALYIFLLIHLTPPPPLIIALYQFYTSNLLRFYFALDFSIFITNTLSHHQSYPLKLLATL